MSEQNTIRPLGHNLLVQKLEREQKAGQIVLPQDTCSFERAIVLEVSRELFPDTPYNQQPVRVGDIVLYVKNADQVVAIGGNDYFVPLAAVSAVESEKCIPEDVLGAESFFKVREWPEFVPRGSEGIWQKWENFKEFSFDIGFMEPFASLDPFRESIYESCANVIGPYVTEIMDPFELKRAAANEESSGPDEPITVIECDHDVFDGVMYLSEKDKRFGFRKQRTTLEALVKSVPVWMKAVHSILRSSPFVSLVRPDYSRILFARFGFKQVIHLESEGSDKDKIQNSQLMGHFMRFGLDDNSPLSPTIAKLGCESIGRSDVKFSFQRKIGNTPYTIWFTAKAPLNEGARFIEIEWDIQDIRPENILDKDYGEVLDNFLRLTVCSEFYSTWFKNINCHSLI